MNELMITHMYLSSSFAGALALCIIRVRVCDRLAGDWGHAADTISLR